MDIRKPDDTYRNISYNDATYRELLEELGQSADTPTHHLSLFLGTYLPAKKEALEDFADAANREVEEIDLDGIVSKGEKETYAAIDALFERYSGTDSILYFKNGDRLCGAYTGFSHSMVKYATPQERYFLKRAREFPGLVIVDISEFTAADKTIRRAAHSVIGFTLPDSSFKRFWWHLKNYSLHGFELKTKRPEAYTRSA